MDALKARLGRVRGFRDGQTAFVGQFAFGKHLVDTVEAAVHHRQARGLRVKRLHWPEQIEHKQQDAHQIRHAQKSASVEQQRHGENEHGAQTIEQVQPPLPGRVVFLKTQARFPAPAEVVG